MMKFLERILGENPLFTLAGLGMICLIALILHLLDKLFASRKELSREQTLLRESYAQRICQANHILLIGLSLNVGIIL